MLNEVDLAMFVTLGEEDLLTLGINAFGPRRALLNAIQEMRH